GVFGDGDGRAARHEEKLDSPRSAKTQIVPGPMSDERDHIGPPDDDTFAAEYVLGVLSAAERAEAERRIARERGFAALVDAWQARLVPWTDEIVPVQPPLDLWSRISTALPAERTAGRGAWGSLMRG